jgi:hypothetical protein|tara:strand:+ start:161 stop:454 length:294 start_codon:yes stop_codon:yes gene_type:complete
MLIQKPIAKNDVVTIKILTGEEIIARYEGEDDSTVSVSRASIVAPNPEGGLGLVPWMMSSAPNKISINKSSVVAMSPTVEPIADKFNEATSEIQIVK